MRILLSVGEFVSQTTKRTLNARVTFYGDGGPGTSFYENPALKPNQLVILRLEVTGIWEAGQSSATLYSNGVPLGALRAIKYNVPFGVGIDVKDPQKPEVLFRRGEPGILVFRNNDAMTYPIRWQLFVPGEAKAIGDSALTLPPNSVIPLSVTAPEEWFTQFFTGFFKSEERDALMTLYFNPPTTAADPVLPVKTVPVKLSLQYWSDSVRGFFGNSIILLVLVAGGFTSLFLSLWIPNKLRRIDLARELEDLHSKTRSVSSKTKSGLRVALRVQRLRLQESLQSIGLLNPGLSAGFDKYQKETTTLARRIDLAQHSDDVFAHMDRLRAQTSGAPPAILDDAAGNLDQATDLLKEVDIDEAGFQKAQTLILEAHQSLANITDDNKEFAGLLAKRVKELREDFAVPAGSIGKRLKCQEIREKMKDVFEFIQDDTYENESNITPGLYHWIDMSIEKLFLIRHYVLRFEDNQNDPMRIQRIKNCEENFLKSLRLQSWNTLHLAKRTRREIEEDIFADDIKEELAKKAIAIRAEPLHPDENESAQLKVWFNHEALNWCAARDEFLCEWDFGSIGQEEGWEISHYFRNAVEAEKVRVRFKKLDGEAIGGDIEFPISIAPVTTKKTHGDRWKIELAQVIIALVIALLGLIVGAREQILKLDMFSGLIAVFMLGFGADTIKNLIAKRPQ